LIIFLILFSYFHLDDYIKETENAIENSYLIFDVIFYLIKLLDYGVGLC